MRFAHVVAAAAALTALSTFTAGPAHASTTVTAWQHAGVWSAPTNESTSVSQVNPGFTYTGLCWLTGKRQTFYNPPVTTDHWVRLALNSGGVGYVWGGALKGDENGNVPNHC
jgi:hypothetical protein